MPAELAETQLQALVERGFQPDSAVATRLLRTSKNIADFEIWSMPPWGDLARGGHIVPLLEALHHEDYAQISLVLVEHPPLWPALLAELETDRWPALEQWVRQNPRVVTEGSYPGWRQACLLTGIAVPAQELVAFFKHKRLGQLARQAFLALGYQEALAAVLASPSVDLEVLPEPTGERALALSAILKRGVVERGLLLEACRDNATAIAEIWRTHRYPSILEWWRQTAGAADGQPQEALAPMHLK